ncbi:MAG: energy-coupling factor ABC transporter permease, partial [Gemmatimonadota bacterium]|nr:energy-coupling factor ABC transporter permease [Gemmatimonadota bacterium]
VLFAVLLVQALLFQDGGIAALGANTLNVAVLGVGSAGVTYRIGRAGLGETRGATVVAAGLAAWISTAIVGLAVAAELVLSGLVPLQPALLLVGGGHVLIGIAEAVLTGLLVDFVFRTRPALLARRTPAARGDRIRVVALAGAVVATVLVAVGFASSQPDVLETALARLASPVGSGLTAAPFAEYQSPVGGLWVAGAVGVLAAFLVAWGLTIAVQRRRP